MTGQPAAAWPGAVRWGHRWLPACGLLLALAPVFLFAGGRDYFYSDNIHDGFTAKNMALAKNLSERGLLFLNMRQRADGTVAYKLYGRFPIGAFVLIKLAIAPFEGDSAAQLAAARALMLAFFCAAAALAYLGLARLSGSRAIALGATLLAFSSHHLLHWRDAVSNEASVDLFAVMLVFHGMVLFHSSGAPGERGGRRLPQLAVKVCAALLLGWHVYGLLLPFLVLGVAAEAAAAWRGPRERRGARERRGRANGAGAEAARPFAGRLATAALRVARGRSVLLGALALVFGAGVLGYNLAREHAALGGQRAVAELPTVRSMLRRTGLDESRYRDAEELAWPTFLKWQFHRVGVACLPVALSGGVELDEGAWRASGKPWFFLGGIAATLGAFAGLALFHRPRAPPAALALAGFCWACMVPGSTGSALHQFETIFHVGVPLCLFTAMLLGARRLGWRRVAGVCAVAGVLIFALSSAAFGFARRDQDHALLQRARMAEFDVIAKTIQGKAVWVAAHPQQVSWRLMKNRSIMDVLTAGGFVHYPDTPEVAGAAAGGASFDFALAFERHDTPALLTPNHRFVFLYEAGGGLEAMRSAWRREYRRLRALAPVARGGGFDIHAVSGEDTGREAGELVYSKTPCGLEDTEGRFYLHLAPADASLAGRRPEFERRDHIFYNGHGVIFDGKCMMRVPLPAWPVARASTGQFHPAGDAASWRTAFRLDVDRLRGVLRALRREAPSARGAFDVYAPRRLRGGTLRYMREPCASDDVRRRFFLHVVPAAAAALPAARLRSGFANLDFDFGERGTLVDGACVATVQLPDYDIARLRTGQFDADARAVAWRVELAPSGAPAER